MASLARTIEIIFSGVDDISDDLNAIDSSISGFAGSVGSATQPLADLAKNILAVETALTAMGGAVLVYSISQASEMEDAQIGLQRVLSDTEGSVKDYEEAIKKMSFEFGVAGSTTTNVTTLFKQAGFTIGEALSITGTALTAMKTAELGAEEAGNLLISTIRGLGAEASEAAHFMDAWNEVSNTFATSAGEVAKATAALSPIAKSAGLSFDDMVGLVTPMIEVLRSGPEAANALKVSLAELITDNPRVTDSLVDLGIAQKDTNGELRLGGDILAELGGIWGGLTESQQANYGIQLFGKEQYSRMNIVLNDYDKVLKVTEVSQGSFGSASKELATALDTSSTSIDRFTTAMNYAAAAVGDEILENSKGVTTSMTGLAQSFESVVSGGGLKPLFDILKPLMTEFSANIDSIAANLPAAFAGLDFTRLVNGFGSVGAELAGLFDGMDLSSAEGLEDALQKIVDSVAVLQESFAGVISGFKPVIDAFIEMGSSAIDADTDTITFLGTLIGAGTTLNVFSGWLEGLSGTLSALTDVILILAGARVLGLLNGSLAGVGAAAGTVASALGKAGLVGAIGSVGFAIGTLIAENTQLDEGLADIFASIDRLVGGPLSQAEEEMKQYAETMAEAAKTTAKQAEAFEPLNDAHVKAKEESDALTKSQEALAKQMEKMGLSADGSTKQLGEMNDAHVKTKEEADKAKAANTGYTSSLVDGVRTYEQTTTGLKKVQTITKDVAQEQKDAKEHADKIALAYADVGVELEKIASNERIKNLEFAVEMNVAKLEADTKQIEAAFESLSSTTESSADLVSALFGSLTEADSRWQELIIESAIKDAQNLMKEQIDKQGELIDAQIRKLDASTDRLEGSDPVLQVDGGNLQPELQSIMESLFNSIKIKMSADYEDFLLGIT